MGAGPGSGAQRGPGRGGGNTTLAFFERYRCSSYAAVPLCAATAADPHRTAAHAGQAASHGNAGDNKVAFQRSPSPRCVLGKWSCLLNEAATTLPDPGEKKHRAIDKLLACVI